MLWPIKFVPKAIEKVKLDHLGLIIIANTKLFLLGDDWQIASTLFSPIAFFFKKVPLSIPLSVNS